jgi:hypothetical protein
MEPLIKLNDLEAKEEYECKISNRFAALENWMIIWTSTGAGKVLERTGKVSQRNYRLL